MFQSGAALEGAWFEQERQDAKDFSSINAHHSPTFARCKLSFDLQVVVPIQ
jgi:hypothetical protein